MLTANHLNQHLASGGIVQITTYARSTLYSSKHAGWFTEDAKGAIYVKRGRSKDQVAMPGRWLVGVRLGRLVVAS